MKTFFASLIFVLSVTSVSGASNGCLIYVPGGDMNAETNAIKKELRGQGYTLAENLVDVDYEVYGYDTRCTIELDGRECLQAESWILISDHRSYESPIFLGKDQAIRIKGVMIKQASSLTALKNAVKAVPKCPNK